MGKMRLMSRMLLTRRVNNGLINDHYDGLIYNNQYNIN